MPKFLTTRKGVSEIEDLIKNAGDKLILISPYLKLSKDFKELLTYRNSQDKVTTIIFGKQELKPDEMKVLQGLQFVILKYNEDLHAKCYANGDKMVITSMNLYEFSMANNKEMGILIEKCDPADTQAFEEAMREVDYVNQTSQRFDFRASEPPPVTKRQDTNVILPKKNIGFCIRTGVEIPFNIEKPLSATAHKKWSEFSNPDYQEKFCHFSGEPSKGETSVGKPILKKNWKKAQMIYGF